MSRLSASAIKGSEGRRTAVYKKISPAGASSARRAGGQHMPEEPHRPRPCWLDSSVWLLIADPTDYSFPSGHTLSSVIGATILTKTDRRFGYAAIPLAALIAFSRLYLYVHFPSDVLAAAVLGVMIGELAFYADRRWTERRGT